MTLDSIDTEIITILKEDGEATHKEIAKKLKIAIGTVNNRIKNLKRDGVIIKNTITVDYDKLGYPLEILTSIKISHGKYPEVSKKLINEDSVHSIFNTTGEWDAIILARFKEKSQFNDFIKRLQKNPNVKETNTRLIINIMRK